LADLLELKEFAIIERNAFTFTNPVFTVLFFKDVLGLKTTLSSGDVGSLKL
jgi:hypothetical protein